jgi:hypothetical protein
MLPWIRSVPAFHFWKGGEKVEVIAGANVEALENTIKDNLWESRKRVDDGSLLHLSFDCLKAGSRAAREKAGTVHRAVGGRCNRNARWFLALKQYPKGPSYGLGTVQRPVLEQTQEAKCDVGARPISGMLQLLYCWDVKGQMHVRDERWDMRCERWEVRDERWRTQREVEFTVVVVWGGAANRQRDV